jgi:hypothetical protein
VSFRRDWDYTLLIMRGNIWGVCSCSEMCFIHRYCEYKGTDTLEPVTIYILILHTSIPTGENPGISEVKSLT